MAEQLPGKGLFGWLGRQVGYVKKAAKAKPAAGTGHAPSPRPDPQPPSVVYREGRVEEAEHPTQPGIKLRRTIIDEVVVDERSTPPPRE